MAANNRKIKFVFLWLLLSTTYVPLSVCKRVCSNKVCYCVCEVLSFYAFLFVYTLHATIPTHEVFVGCQYAICDCMTDVVKRLITTGRVL